MNRLKSRSARCRVVGSFQIKINGSLNRQQVQVATSDFIRIVSTVELPGTPPYVATATERNIALLDVSKTPLTVRTSEVAEQFVALSVV